MLPVRKTIKCRYNQYDLIFQHPSLDSSVVSAEHSILFTNGELANNNNSSSNSNNMSKDGVIKEILRRKLLALDSDETRL